MTQTKPEPPALATLVLPIVGGLMSQQLLSLVDTLMVAQMGRAALAAAGSGSFMAWLVIALFSGFSAAVQVLVAQYRGENRDPMPLFIRSALAVAPIALGLSLLGIALAPQLMALFPESPEVRALSVPFFQLRMIGLLPIAMIMLVRGYHYGQGRPIDYLLPLLAMQLTNVVLNWRLIYGTSSSAGLGSSGAALASSMASLLGAILFGIQMAKRARGSALQQRTDRAQAQGVHLWPLFRIAWPRSLQQLIFTGGMSLFFAILATLGTEAQASSNVLLSIQRVIAFVPLAYGLGITTQVGRAVGAKQMELAKRLPFRALQPASLLTVVAVTPLFLFPETVLRVFSSDDAAILGEVSALRLLGLSLLFEAPALIAMQALIGAGHSQISLKISSLLQWGLFLPLAWLAVHRFGLGLTGVFGMLVIYRAVAALSFSWAWAKRGL